MNDLQARLADFDIDGWELDDGEALNREFPDTFWIPSAELRGNLQPDDLVKLVFRIITVDENGEEEVNVERMWVIVKGRIGDLYRGLLDNTPFCTDDLPAGSSLWFQARHVIDIYEDNKEGEA